LYVADDEARGVFHAIADPTRRLILDELVQRDDQTLYELCVRMLTGHGIDMTRQGIEKHLAVLEEAGLVVSERRGKYKVLRLDAGPLRRDVEPWLRNLTSHKDRR
jgi:DNA-binding transcriptional ArsR family regulator